MSTDGAGPTGLPSEELRALVREMLLQAIPGALAAAGAAGGGPTGDWADRPDAEAPEVSVRTDDELAALVQAVARECADPQRRQDLEAGRAGYRLAAASAAGSRPGTTAATAAPATVLRVERGAVTERSVRHAAETGASIVAARGVVVTPLARDRARTSGVDIEKEH